MPRLSTTHLFRSLQTQDAILAATLLTLEELVGTWLSYVVASFPHFTSHALDHSVRIVENLSQILFKDTGESIESTVALSPIESFILISAALLHDAGMVVSDAEKLEILTTEEWRGWINAERREQWEAIERFRAADIPPDADLRNFIADRQLRILLAEYVRRRHPVRAVNLIQQKGPAFLGHAFEDLGLRGAIQDVCLGHGLAAADLLEDFRFPQRRTISGQQVNVRFLAILLRLGDLLDMDSDRACPLLMSAAAPLPSDSALHWSQYSHIRHLLIAPDRIEIDAECATREEHRILLDWCQWLVDETEFATTTMSRALRHGGWVAPEARLNNPNPTITIRKAPGATYLLHDWRLQFDETEVFQRLIRDVYQEPLAFLRELIQNAADATRCRLYGSGVVSSADYPQQIPVEIARQYPIAITLTSGTHRNELFGIDEDEQVVTVEDLGCGMAEDIITRYFLQVGRSFYRSPEFQRTFTFTPVSQFGLGFLSVFEVSERVQVDTLASTPGAAAGTQLILTGPRNYIITERSDRRVPGTVIKVALRKPIELKDVVKAVSYWCRRLEFPILVTSGTERVTVEREWPDEFHYEAPVYPDTEARLEIRPIPLDEAGITGELYVLVYSDSRGERWDRYSWAAYTYPTTHPLAMKPPMPPFLLAVSGFTVVAGGPYDVEPTARVDVRRPFEGISVSRGYARLGGPFLRRDPPFIPELQPAWERALTEHLLTTSYASGDDGWRYKQRLMDTFTLPFWRKVEGMVPVLDGGERILSTVEDVIASPSIWVTEHVPADARKMAGLIILADDLKFLAASCRSSLFHNRAPTCVLIGKSYNGWQVEWVINAKIRWLGSGYRPIAIASCDPLEVLGLRLHKARDDIYPQTFINARSDWGAWLTHVMDALEELESPLLQTAFDQVIWLLNDPLNQPGYNVDRVNAYLDKWSAIPGVTDALLPPARPLTRSDFWSEDSSSWPTSQ